MTSKISESLNIQPGHIARHTPAGAGAQGKEAAVIDVAQDLLLSHLSDIGALDNLAIKGGTALRKLYAGKEGRFSLDLDFSVASVNSNLEKSMLDFVEAVDGFAVGPFEYGVAERRGKWSIAISSYFIPEQTLTTKLDFAPASWLEPVKRPWVSLPIHAQYGKVLPRIKRESGKDSRFAKNSKKCKNQQKKQTVKETPC